MSGITLNSQFANAGRPVLQRAFTVVSDDHELRIGAFLGLARVLPTPKMMFLTASLSNCPEPGRILVGWFALRWKMKSKLCSYRDTPRTRLPYRTRYIHPARWPRHPRSIPQPLRCAASIMDPTPMRACFTVQGIAASSIRFEHYFVVLDACNRITEEMRSCLRLPL